MTVDDTRDRKSVSYLNVTDLDSRGERGGGGGGGGGEYRAVWSTGQSGNALETDSKGQISRYAAGD